MTLNRFTLLQSMMREESLTNIILQCNYCRYTFTKGSFIAVMVNIENYLENYALYPKQ
jgi:hypothetical protein